MIDRILSGCFKVKPLLLCMSDEKANGHGEGKIILESVNLLKANWLPAAVNGESTYPDKS
jgi:hypothetical protein